MKREIVVEIEQVKRIRKRTSSQLKYCIDCGRHVDFIAVRRAAELFERDAEEMQRFIRINRCHTQLQGTEIHICLIALLEAIEAVSKNSRIRMIGDLKKHD